MVECEELEQYLTVTHHSKRWIRDRVRDLLSSEKVVPSFSAAAVRLADVARDENVGMEEVAQIISMDPGLTTRCIQVASTGRCGGRKIVNIEQALMMIGMVEVRRIAFSVGVMDRFTHMKIKMDWNRFWLHNILVARLTHKVAAAFRETCGLEYLAGLLHDVGKLIIENYFPREFQMIVLRAMERKIGHIQLEQEILGLGHSQIGAAICDRLHLHGHVLRGIWYHHDPTNRKHVADPLGDGGFLAACISVADALANLASANIEGARQIDIPFQELPEWVFFNYFDMPNGLELDLEFEIDSATQDLQAFNG
jgi:HD-like signal output (HDOD) protein